MDANRIVVLGGYGTFGNLISSDLAQSSNVIVAGRNKEIGEKFADSIHATFSLCNVKDSNSLRKTIGGADIVINASGPFYPDNYSIPTICIEEKCHYIDLADDRAYVQEFPQLDTLAKSNKVFVCTGASTCPAITYSLAVELKAKLQKIQSIRIYMNAGNKNQAGVSTFASILSYAGAPIQMWNNKKWETHMGWGLPETFAFPLPVGKRLVQLCNVPDLDLFPDIFEADEVVFKAGVELPIFNIGFSMLANIKRQLPGIDLSTLAKPLINISKWFKNFGSYSGGIQVNMVDNNGNQKSLALVTSENGPRIPASPATLLAQKLMDGKIQATGAFPCIGLIRLDEFQKYLESFGIKFISSEALSLTEGASHSYKRDEFKA